MNAPLHPPDPPLLVQLEALAGKYRVLTVLRTRREELEDVGRRGFSAEENATRREAFRRVAAQFPGALRELDTTPARILATKLVIVEDDLDAARADPAAFVVPRMPWITVVLDFHATLREALAVKLWLARRIGRDGTITAEVVAECAAWHARYPHGRRAVDRADLATLHHPPGGRVLALVWRELAARHGRPRAELEHDVFGW